MLKKTIFPALISCLLFWSCGGIVYVETQPVRPSAPVYNPQQVENNEPLNYQTFYDALAPFGTWVEDNEYGYVWVPDVGRDFQPYQNRGHWVYTEFGWTWVSDYQWGWATFHYGRWRFTGDYGWIWIPGYTWGPAWVAWRTNGDYFGWAPLGPPSHPREEGYYREHPSEHISIGLSFSFNDTPEPSHWCFVPANQIASPQINNYYVNRSQNTVIYQNTTIINNVTTVNNTTINNFKNNRNTNTTMVNNFYGNNSQSGYVAGPRREDVERITGNRISPIPVSNSNRPGQTNVSGNSLTFFRPAIKAPDPSPVATGFKPAPKQVISINQVTPVYNRYQERGVGSNNAASNISSTDNNPVEAARLRAQNPNPNFNRPQTPNNDTQNPNQLNNPNHFNHGAENPQGNGINLNNGNGNPNPNIANPNRGNLNNGNPMDGNPNNRNLNNSNINPNTNNNLPERNNPNFRSERGMINPNPNFNGNGSNPNLAPRLNNGNFNGQNPPPSNGNIQNPLPNNPNLNPRTNNPNQNQNPNQNNPNQSNPNRNQPQGIRGNPNPAIPRGNRPMMIIKPVIKETKPVDNSNLK